ncbi:MAG: hypothetical protein KF914_01190 [Rhizobiaceae bacterium]|nr:hypothetical protein [Rhizobiaceae bacterium]
MKAGLSTSLILHAAVLGFGLLTLSAPAPLEVADVESLPVDIVPIEELTQIQQGEKAAPMTEKAAPKPTERPDTVADAQTVGENTVDAKNAPTPEPKPRPVETAAVPKPSPQPVDKPDPQAKEEPKVKPEPAPTTEVAPVPKPKQEVKPEPVRKAEPTPEPVKQPTPEPQPVKEAKPEPKPEPKVAEQPKEPVKEAKPEPKPQPKAAEKPAEQPKEQVKPDAVAETIVAEASVAEASAAPAAEANPVKLPDSAPAPASRPSPPQAQAAQTPERKNAEKPAAASSSRPQSSEKEFNADEVAALLNKDKPSGGGAKRSKERASLGGEKTTGGAKLSQSEMDALRGQVQRCWNIPAGALDGDKLRVSVKFKLDRSGAIDGSPEIISGGGASGVERAAAEAARRAVSRCAPYNLPADKYDAWADVIVNFDPSEMY